MSTKSATSKASERAHDVVEQLESTVSDLEERIKDASVQATETAEALSREAQAKATESLVTIEKFVRQKPLQAAGIAFAAGILTAVVLRRR